MPSVRSIHRLNPTKMRRLEIRRGKRDWVVKVFNFFGEMIYVSAGRTRDEARTDAKEKEHKYLERELEHNRRLAARPTWSNVREWIQRCFA